MRHENTIGRKIRDLVIYVFVAVAIVLVAAWIAIHEAQTNSAPGGSLKWVAFAAFSALAFGYPIRAFRHFWPSLRFRLVLFALVAAHLTIAIPILLKVNSVSLGWYCVGAVVESGLISGCFAWTLRSRK